MSLSEYFTGMLAIFGLFTAIALLVYLTFLAHYHIKVWWIKKKKPHLSRYGADGMYDYDFMLLFIFLLELAFIIIPAIMLLKNILNP